jgi:hypothetical protein
MGSTIWVRTMMRRMRMMTMKGTPAPAAVPEEFIEEEVPVENGPVELDDLDDLGDLDEDPNEGHSDVDEWFPQDRSNDRD